MPTVYRFRVSFEEYDDVFRDIEIRSNQTFEDLHYIIQSAINFDATKSASFIMSNDYWIKGQEIALQPKNDREGNALPLMADSRLSNFIVDPHQKIIYISDYEANWNLQIELIKLLPSADEKRNYPVCVKTSGEAPKQYTVVIPPKVAPSLEDELSAMLMGSALAGADEEEEEEDDLPEKENLMEEAEDGVEMDEIEGMNEEGEDEETSEEDGEEMGFQDADEDARDDQY